MNAQVITFDHSRVDKKISIGLYLPSGYREFTSFDAFLEVLGNLQGNAKRKPRLMVYSHSMDNHQNKSLLHHLLTNTSHRVQFPEGVGQITWKDKNIIFTNAYSLLPTNLKTLHQAFGTFSLPGTLEGSCSALSEAITAWAELILTEFHTILSSTLATTSVKVLDNEFYPLKRIEGNIDFAQQIRAATYGMRNEIYRKYGENIYFYDVHNMFMSCYDVPVPIGRLQWTRPNIDRGTIAEAKVKVPLDMHLGPLPYRYHGQLCFPVGEFQSTWDIRELRNAVRLGCDISLIKQAEADEEPILDEFGKHVCDLRGEANKHLKKLWKQFGILLYGKFGQRKSRGTIKHITDMTLDEQDFSTPILESDERYHSIPIKKAGRSPYKKPAISMRIRAEARIRHLDHLLAASKVGQLYYCDTDSVVCSSELETFDGPGELGYVDFAVRAYFIKQKFYGYVRPDGHLVQKTAGHSGKTLTAEKFHQLLNLQEVAVGDFRSCSWRDLFQTDPLEKIYQTSIILGKDPPRNRILEGDTDTIPISLPRTEVPEVFQEALK